MNGAVSKKQPPRIRLSSILHAEVVYPTAPLLRLAITQVLRRSWCRIVPVEPPHTDSTPFPPVLPTPPAHLDGVGGWDDDRSTTNGDDHLALQVRRHRHRFTREHPPIASVWPSPCYASCQAQEITYRMVYRLGCRVAPAEVGIFGWEINMNSEKLYMALSGGVQIFKGLISSSSPTLGQAHVQPTSLSPS